MANAIAPKTQWRAPQKLYREGRSKVYGRTPKVPKVAKSREKSNPSIGAHSAAREEGNNINVD